MYTDLTAGVNSLKLLYLRALGRYLGRVLILKMVIKMR